MGLACCKDKPVTQTVQPRSLSSSVSHKNAPTAQVSPIQKEPTSAFAKYTKPEEFPSTSSEDLGKNRVSPFEGVQLVTLSSNAVKDEVDEDIKHEVTIETETPSKAEDSSKNEAAEQSELQQSSKPEEIHSDIPPPPSEPPEVEVPETEVQEVQTPEKEVQETENSEIEQPVAESTEEEHNIRSDASHEKQPQLESPPSEPHEEVRVPEPLVSELQPEITPVTIESEPVISEETSITLPTPVEETKDLEVSKPQSSDLEDVVQESAPATQQEIKEPELVEEVQTSEPVVEQPQIISTSVGVIVEEEEEEDVPPPLPTCPPPESDEEEDYSVRDNVGEPFPDIKSKHSLVAKYVTKDLWDKLSGIKTDTSGFTLAKAISCAVQFDNQHCGIYAGDWDSYKVFREVFDPIIQEYHGIASDSRHTSDMEVSKLRGNIKAGVPVHSVRIRVGRNIDGFGLSPGITKDQRLGVENLMKNAFKKLTGDLSGNYYPLTGMEETVRQQLVDDHFLFMSGDPNLQVAGMEREWPEGRGIYHNKEKSFLVWVNEEDQLRIISMQKGGDVKAVFERLARGIKAVGDSVKTESGKEFAFDNKYGFIHSCPTNLGTGMRASVHIDLPGWTKEGLDALKKRCEELKVQPRGTRGESGGQTGVTYDISNKHRLGYSEVELVQCMIDGVNTLYEEDVKLQKKHGIAK